jgi:hypothetical protein
LWPISEAECCIAVTFGRASAPMMPHRVHAMRGPKVGTGTSSGHGSALMIAGWWSRTPLGHGLDQVFEARHRGQPPFASSVANTVRPSCVSRAAGSR